MIYGNIKKVVYVFSFLLAGNASNAEETDRASYSSCSQLSSKWRDVEGIWISAVGPLELTVKDNLVTGIYNKRTWVISLKYSKDKKYLYGKWDHQNGLKGPVILLLADNGCIKHGLWGAVGKRQCLPTNYSSCVNNWAIHGIKEVRINN